MFQKKEKPARVLSLLYRVSGITVYDEAKTKTNEMLEDIKKKHFRLDKKFNKRLRSHQRRCGCSSGSTRSACPAFSHLERTWPPPPHDGTGPWWDAGTIPADLLDGTAPGRPQWGHMWVLSLHWAISSVE